MLEMIGRIVVAFFPGVAGAFLASISVLSVSRRPAGWSDWALIGVLFLLSFVFYGVTLWILGF